MDLGQLICTPFSYIVSAVNSWTGSYILALLAFTVVMKIVLFPLSAKQQKNSVRQAKLRPKEEAIRAKYAGRNDKPTQQKMQQEVMEMYQEEKFSPLSGCMPLLLQLPLLLILYSIVRAPLQYTARYTVEESSLLTQAATITEHYDLSRDAQNLAFLRDGEDMDLYVVTADGTRVEITPDADMRDGRYVILVDGKEDAELSQKYQFNMQNQSAIVSEIKENPDYYASAYELIWHGAPTEAVRGAAQLDLSERLPQFKLFDGAIDLGETPTLAFNWLLVFPILTLITSFASQWVTRKFTYQPQTQQTEAAGGCNPKMMNVMMPLMSVWISFIVPSALAVYWIMQNLIAPLQQIILAKMYPVPQFSEEELKKAKNEYLAKAKGKGAKGGLPAPKRRSLVYDDDDEEGAGLPAAPQEQEQAPKSKEKQKSAPQEDSPIDRAELK